MYFCTISCNFALPMDSTSGRIPLMGMTLAELTSVATEHAMPKYAGGQMARWIYQKHAHTISEMTDLRKADRERLAQRYEVGIMPHIDVRQSNDGTRKYLFPTEGGGCVETVFIPDGERATLCVSCQEGCKMNCMFCHTGKQGFVANLTTGDILNQVYALPEADRLTNIVFMGQGEPLDNLENVLRATDILQASYGLAWSPKRITVSSVGLKGKLRRFLDESQCHLAISLHSAKSDLRRRLMPAEKSMPIRDIVDLLKNYDFSHQRRLTFEYVMMHSVNDGLDDAKALVDLIGGMDCRVNLIRFHESDGIDIRCSSKDDIEKMNNYLNTHGILTTTRTSRGEDIEAACGLLSTINKNKDVIQ